MEHTEEHIDKFVHKVRNRLNKHFGLTVLTGSLVFGGVVMAAIALSYIIRGYHVPLFWYPVCFAGSLLTGGCLWFYFKHSHDQAARFTDKHFSLKDSVRSYSGFHRAGKNSGFYKLQANQTESRLSSVSIKSIRYKCPTFAVVLAIVAILSSGLMGFMDDSPAVRQKIAQEKFLLENTKTINEEINEIMEALQKELEEKNLDKVVDMNEVRQKAGQLEETSDIKDAMRQYAQLERELGEAMSKLTQRQDEQLLDRMGKELQKDDATQALGSQLTQKEYDAASQEMEKFKIDPQAAMEIQEAQLEKLKEMAARMAEEAGKTESGANQKSLNGQNQTGQQGNQNQQSSGNRLAQLAQQLNQSAQELSEAMNNQVQSGQSQDGQQSTGQMQQMAQNANQSLGNMGQFLQQLDAKRQAQSMMQGMLNSLAQSQMGLGNMPGAGQDGQGQTPGQNGQGQTQANSPNPGGRDAGTGTSNAANTEPGKDAPDGQKTQVQGMHGTGASMTSTEESSSGSGSSAGTLEREEQEYMRQVESFIRREDVPESVKAGVKAYFENIHNVDDTHEGE